MNRDKIMIIIITVVLAAFFLFILYKAVSQSTSLYRQVEDFDPSQKDE